MRNQYSLFYISYAQMSKNINVLAHKRAHFCSDSYTQM